MLKIHTYTFLTPCDGGSELLTQLYELRQNFPDCIHSFVINGIESVDVMIYEGKEWIEKKVCEKLKEFFKGE